jgi:hypothetical protein
MYDIQRLYSAVRITSYYLLFTHHMTSGSDCSLSINRHIFITFKFSYLQSDNSTVIN